MTAHKPLTLAADGTVFTATPIIADASLDFRGWLLTVGDEPSHLVGMAVVNDDEVEVTMCGPYADNDFVTAVVQAAINYHLEACS